MSQKKYNGCQFTIDLDDDDDDIDFGSEDDFDKSIIWKILRNFRWLITDVRSGKLVEIVASPELPASKCKCLQYKTTFDIAMRTKYLEFVVQNGKKALGRRTTAHYWL